MENCSVVEQPRSIGFGSSFFTIFASLPWCCILPPIITAIAGSSFGGVPAWVQLTLLPFVAWPALLWTHYKFWTHRAKCFEGSTRKQRINAVIVTIATCIFLYFLWTDYIPKLQMYTSARSPTTISCGMKGM